MNVTEDPPEWIEGRNQLRTGIDGRVVAAAGGGNAAGKMVAAGLEEPVALCSCPADSSPHGC